MESSQLLLQPRALPSHGAARPRGRLGTQGWTELAVGGERTKTQAAKGTRKWKVRASEWKAER